MNKNITSRRKFFSKVGKGSMGAIVLSMIPMKMFGSKKQFLKLKNVTPHHGAIKREV